MSRARVLLTAALALAVAALTVLGTVLPPTEAGVPPSASAAGPARAGGVICPLGDAADGATLDLVVAAPAAAGADGSGPAAARATVVILGDESGRIAPEPLGPGGVVGVRAPVAAGGAAWVGWADAPVVVWREWVRSSAPGVPRGRTAGACVSADATTWHVVGLRTDGGSEARLRVVNPFAVDATVAITLVTSEGAVAPIALQNVSVPARGVTDVRVNDHVPERADVAALVHVTSGRAAVEVLQIALAGVGGIDGITLVPALTAAASTWTLPWVPVDGDAWVSVLNPSERDVDLELTLHTAAGPGLPEGVDVVTVPAGGLVRIPARDLAGPGDRAVGLTLRSPTDAVVVGGGLRIDPGDPAASGLAALPALPGGDTAWLVAGHGGGERTEELHVVNVAATESAVTVAVSVRTAGGEPRDLAPVVVPPGATARVPLPLRADGAWSAEVVADGAIVVARAGRGPEAPEPVAAAGVPAGTWRGDGPALVGRRRDGWTLRSPLP